MRLVPARLVFGSLAFAAVAALGACQTSENAEDGSELAGFNEDFNSSSASRVSDPLAQVESEEALHQR